MDKVTLNKVPLNHEHAEAHQADIDRRRAQIKINMSETAQGNLELIEKVSNQLKQANIAFVLFAQPCEIKKGFFQFNWLYTEGSEDFYSEKGTKSAAENFNNFIRGCHQYIGGLGFFIGMTPPQKRE